MEREALRQRYVTLEETEQDAQWEKGAALFAYLRETARQASNPREARRLRSHVLKDIASVVGQATVRVRQQLDVFVAFGVDGSRALDKPWHWHLCVVRAASRTKTNPRLLLDEALAKGWGAADLTAFGKATPVTAQCAADCADCGARVRVTIDEAQVTPERLAVTLRCPVCAAVACAAGGDGREAARLGQLEGWQ